MSAIIVSGASVSNDRELKNRDIHGNLVYTMPVADVIQGHIIAKLGNAITTDNHGEMIALDLSGAWQDVTGLGKAIKRAVALFPVGLNVRYSEVTPGVLIQLHADDARAYGCDLSVAQPYDAAGYPAGDPVEGVIAVTERAMFLALQQQGALPGFSTLQPSGRVPGGNVINHADLLESVKHVREHGPVATPAVRRDKQVILSCFPSGSQRNEREQAVELARAASPVANRLASLKIGGTVIADAPDAGSQKRRPVTQGV